MKTLLKSNYFILIVFLLTGNINLAQETVKKPNVILLLTDDMGYGDLTCYGGQAVNTPNIDKLAQEGMRFNRFYSAAAVCTPSRASILTGKYPLRFDIQRHFTDNGEALPFGTTTIPKLLSKAGYETWHIGKWHLGGIREKDFIARQAGEKTPPGPLQHGFTHSLTSIEDHITRRVLINERRLYRDGGQYMYRNDERAPVDKENWTSIKVSEAIRLMEKNQSSDKPFFLNIWFDVPHTPYEPAPEPHLSKYEKMGATGNQLYFRSMVSNLDANIGRLVAKLKSLGLFENTLILFTSDNGAAFEGEVGPFKGGKTDLHEGGIRVPFFAVWPGKIPENVVSFQRAHHTDLLPTICEAVGVSIDEPIDGMSILPSLTNDKTIDRGLILWEQGIYGKMQRHYKKPEPHATTVAYKGPWKLLLNKSVPLELFHLENDPHEENNLLEKNPKIVGELLDEAKKFVEAPRLSSFKYKEKKIK